MSALSTVGIAARSATSMSSLLKEHPWVKGDPEDPEHQNPVLEKNGSVLILLETVYWGESNPAIKYLHDWLRKPENINDFMLVEACFAYPDSAVRIGEFDDNPWNLYQEVRLNVDE